MSGQVVLEGVTKRFGAAVAVDNLSLTVDDEELFVLLGPSGCGKSTVLRLIAGLDEPTEGTISIGGNRVDGVDAKDRDIAMVFQSYALYPHMTVRRNVEFPLRARGTSSQERDLLVTRAAAALDLGALLERKPGQLSGGERQRVALARAIVRQPVAFLMDEPLSNLDAKLRVQTRAELVALHRRLAATIVYVTHDQVEAMTMGQRLAVLDRGVLQQVGAPQAVYDRPANLFVARFIGSPPMNTLAGAVTGDGDAGGLAVRLAGPADGSDGLSGAMVPLGPSQAALVRAAGLPTVVVGVRPEDLLLDAAGTVTATVAVIESLGHERHVVCRLADGTLWTALVSAGGPCPAVAETVRLRARPDALHLFDPLTGSRLDDRRG